MINSSDIIKIASLARLPLEEADIARYSEEFRAIFAYMQILEEVDTTHTEPTYHVHLAEQEPREDQESYPLGEPSTYAPVSGNYIPAQGITIPRIIDAS